MWSVIMFYSTLTMSLQVIDTARILAWFPIPSISHQVVFRPLTQELAKRRHEITVVTPDPVFPKGQAPKNLTEIDVHDISYGAWREFFVSKQNEMTDDLEVQMRMIFHAGLEVVEKQIKTTEFKNVINGHEKFDLLLIEGVCFAALAIRHKIKAPVVLINSMGAAPGQMESFGAPVHPFVYPISMSKKSFNLNKWEKIQELYMQLKINRVYGIWFENAHKVMSKYFGEDLPPLAELSYNVDLLLLNEHPVWSGIRPVPPGVVFIGGIHQNPRKDLPEDLKTYLDSSKHGVIYMSFGTNVDPSVLPPEKILAFIKAFSELPYDVLWKWNEDELPGRTENIRISKWFPQSDLLHHPNVKLFITQGGLQSTDEAIAAGVPVIGVPVIGDQWYNTERYVHHRVGLQLEIRNLDAEIVKNAIETVIGDPSYQENMVRMRDLMRDEPMSSLERAVWWTEHVLRHNGTRHLRAPAANMTWSQYYELELMLTVLAFILATLLGAIVIGSVIVRFLREKFKAVKMKRS